MGRPLMMAMFLSVAMGGRPSSLREQDGDDLLLVAAKLLGYELGGSDSVGDHLDAVKQRRRLLDRDALRELLYGLEVSHVRLLSVG